MAQTRVKICGITNVEDAAGAVDAGADALGFNFYDGSPRFVAPTLAASIISSLPPFVSTVGLFVNPAAGFVRECLAQCPLDVLQFHGDEDEAFCNQFGRPYIKVLRLTRLDELPAAAAPFGSARGLLADRHVDGQFGGTGQTLLWQRVQTDRALILAGGLGPDNVAEAIEVVRPYAVDVSSGVEVTRARKDPALMHAFVAAVRHADRELS